LHLREPRRHTWLFLLICAAAVGLIFAIPIVMIVWFSRWIMHR